MNIQRILRKSLLLIISYIFFIFGIFVLQFRSGATVTEKFGDMRVSVVLHEQNDSLEPQKNSMNVSFNGISFFSNKDSPILAMGAEDSEQFPLELVGWKKINDLSCVFDYSENVRITFSVGEASEKNWLEVGATFPENIKTLSVPYEISSGYAVDQQNNSSITVSGRNANWIFSAAEIGGLKFLLNPYQAVAMYRFSAPSEVFTFADIPEMETASLSAYQSAIGDFKNALVSSFQNAFRNNVTSFTEHEIVAFIAAMAEIGRYSEALDMVPQSFKTGSGRTYFSAPYFNSLANSNRTFTTKLSALASFVRAGNEESPFEVLENEGIENYIIVSKNSPNVAAFVEKLANDVAQHDFDGIFTLSEAINTLRFYNVLSSAGISFAMQLANSAAVAAAKIESLSSLQNETLTISEDGVLPSAVDIAKAGDALVRYGTSVGINSYVRAGCLLLSTLFANAASFDSQTLAALYPIVVHDNLWYPHVLILEDNSTNFVWAWTCARNIRYYHTENTSVIEIDFTETLSHHVIFRGIGNFGQIRIYDTLYRSDPRFESYNASGYIYQADTQSLLVKSRHRSRIETIVLDRTQNLGD